MAFKDWFAPRSRLQLALERGMKPNADLQKELRQIGEYKIKSHRDAETLCAALDRVKHDKVGGDSALHALTALFQSVPDRECEAFSAVRDAGTSILASIVASHLNGAPRFDANEILFALKILAMYGTHEGTELVIHAARQHFESDAYMWHVILAMYTARHPEFNKLLDALADPLPRGFIAVSLLDSANKAFVDGVERSHPFDSLVGVRQLESWLLDSDDERSSYAVSAAAALPFVSEPEQTRLLAIALDHSSVEVQLEAAWAAAKLGREAGIKCLAHYCADVNYSDKAKRYLAELGREDAVPHEAGDADFQALAMFAQWLAHPNELGRNPDELTVLDHRELRWPPEFEMRPLWLVKYRLRDRTGVMDDDVGVGLVGSVTFCLFSYKLEERPPEDCYAIHCCWELEREGLISAMELEEHSSDYNQLLQKWRPDGLTEARLIQVFEISHKLAYPQRILALATAKMRGEEGWAVIDGERSRFYQASEMPAGQFGKLVAMIHIGRELLRLQDCLDRKTFLRSDRPQRPPEEVVAAYERLLSEAAANPTAAKRVLGRHGLLGSRFQNCVDAFVTSTKAPRSACVACVYESMLETARVAPVSLHNDLFDNWAPLGTNFEAYVDALTELNRHADAANVINQFAPYWNHNLGFGVLGAAAFKSGHDQLAETFFLKLRESKDWCRSREMAFLSEIWHRQGRVDESRELLVGAMRGVLTQSKAATGSDRKLFEEWFQNHRSTFLRLFPQQGDEWLRTQGISSSTI